MSDAHIADLLACANESVYAKRKKLGMPKPVVKYDGTPILITDPIDYPRLANAFIKARWKYNTGDRVCFPDAEYLKGRIEADKADLANRPGFRECCSSGGINIEWRDGKIVVLLAPRLAMRYLPNLEPEQKETEVTEA